MAKEVHVGEVFGAWVVLEKLPYGNKYKCQCTACNKTIQNIRVYDLLSGKTRLCKRCSVRQTRQSHGMSDSGEYNSWCHMIQRCYNESSKDYPNYGGRGITVCDIWRDSFEAFYMSLGPRPNPGDTLERLDYNKGYEPGNVVWAPRTDQVLNKRDNVKLTIDGETKTVSEWSRISGVNLYTIYKRVDRGWVEQYGEKYTVFTPTRGSKEDSDE